MMKKAMMKKMDHSVLDFFLGSPTVTAGDRKYIEFASLTVLTLVPPDVVLMKATASM